MKLYCLGLGPGDEGMITPQVTDALKSCDTVIGYHVYINLIKDMIADKEIITTPMKGEADRCRQAIDMARQGKCVAVVSSGDAGVYGMAGLLYELLGDLGDNDTIIEVLPGITAATSAAAILGAPLTHDFAVISLSDLLTPWADIEKRLEAASSSGFVICIYNPESVNRAGYLKKACDIVSKYLKPSTACGYVRNIARVGEVSDVLTLAKLSESKADMFTTVIIGNSNTKIINQKLVTPRGYRI